MMGGNSFKAVMLRQRMNSILTKTLEVPGVKVYF